MKNKTKHKQIIDNITPRRRILSNYIYVTLLIQNTVAARDVCTRRFGRIIKLLFLKGKYCLHSASSTRITTIKNKRPKNCKINVIWLRLLHFFILNTQQKRVKFIFMFKHNYYVGYAVYKNKKILNISW